jgi:hypothetical protein
MIVGKQKKAAIAAESWSFICKKLKSQKKMIVLLLMSTIVAREVQVSDRKQCQAATRFQREDADQSTSFDMILAVVVETICDADFVVVRIVRLSSLSRKTAATLHARVSVPYAELIVSKF